MEPENPEIQDIFHTSLPPNKDVEKVRDKFEEKVLSTIWEIDNDITRARDKGWKRDGEGESVLVPIYLTKTRVKSLESIFLKTKRKLDGDYKKITDYAGLRVLVMFDDQLLEVLEYLLHEIISPEHLKEVTLFNMPKEIVAQVRSSPALQPHVDEGFDLDSEDHFREIERASGYQSIHFLFTKNVFEKQHVKKNPYGGRNFYFEIQLRTVLQDVWGEMEHKLSYKQGKANPNIQTSFKLLQEDITTMGRRLADIKTLRSKHLALDRLSVRGSKPFFYFHYEPDFDPLHHIDESAEAHGKIKEYYDWARKFDNDELTAHGFSHQARERLEDLNGVYNQTFAGNKTIRANLGYWEEMEKAYLCFLENDYDGALQLYKGVCKDERYADRPVPHFRCGEALFAALSNRADPHAYETDTAELVKCISAFDNAITCLKPFDHADNRDDLTKIIGARILTKIATIYELLGSDEYMDYCVSLLKGAEKLLEQVTEETPNPPKPYIGKNNLGWILIEKHRTAKEKEKLFWYEQCLEVMAPVLSKVQESINKDPDSLGANVLDTAAWFLYQSYQHLNKDAEARQKALEKEKEPPQPTANEGVFELLDDEILNNPEIADETKRKRLLKIAQDYCTHIWSSRNNGVFKASSMNRHRNHTQIIMDPKNETT